MCDGKASSACALVFASAGDPIAAGLGPALRASGMEAIVVDQVAHGLGMLCGRAAAAPNPTLVIILGGLSGLPEQVIANAVRSLPGSAAMPIIVTGQPPADLAGAGPIAVAQDAVAICGLAVADPRSWPPLAVASPAGASVAAGAGGTGPSSPGQPGDGVLDPAVLQRLDRRTPGTSGMILAVLRTDLRGNALQMPRLLASGRLADLGREAHKLKGASGSIGAIELSCVCGALERCARDGDRDGAAAALAAVLAAIARLQERIDRFHPC